MSSAAAQHQILAESAVKAVSEFQMQTTKIIRYLERN